MWMRQDGYLNITHESESGINFTISKEHAASQWSMMYGKVVQLYHRLCDNQDNILPFTYLFEIIINLKLLSTKRIEYE